MSFCILLFSGPVVQNINIIPVYWNSAVNYQSNLNVFYSAFVSSAPVFTFLSQYSTTNPKQTIGKGTFGTPYVSNQASNSVTDAQVQSFLTTKFNAGTLTKPNNNNVFTLLYDYTYL